MSEAKDTAPEQAPLIYDSTAPGAISAELLPVIEELGLFDACQHLVEHGWAVVENVSTPEFNAALRAKILEVNGGKEGGKNMLLRHDPIFAEVVLNPNLLAMAEFSVGRGCLISQVASSVRPKGSAALALHADANWMPAPLPEHNMLLTVCWACDEFTQENGATMVVPGTKTLRRHPTAEETDAKTGAISIDCPAGSVAMWDGNVWHGNWPREAEGERVASHITYTRLMCRPVEDYSADADKLIEAHGERIAQLLGRRDSLQGPEGFVYQYMSDTFNNAKR
jgi:hypothetical protein|tara:strand:- start:408 stop:1250 length:843 start_codon:yes stop_codon:yes gene_type:complete